MPPLYTPYLPCRATHLGPVDPHFQSPRSPFIRKTASNANSAVSGLHLSKKLDELKSEQRCCNHGEVIEWLINNCRLGGIFREIGDSGSGLVHLRQGAVTTVNFS